MTTPTSNNLYSNEANQRIDLREIAEKLEIDFGQAIFDKLTHTENKHNKATRLFDETKNTSEVYYAKSNTGKPTIYDFKSCKTYFPLTAYPKSTGKDWETSVIELGKEFGLIPMEYDSTPKPKWEYKPKIVITENEKCGGVGFLANPVCKPLEGAYLEFWEKYGIPLDLLKQAKISTLESFDIVNLSIGETNTIKPKFSFIYDLEDGVYKAYQPNHKKYKWNWIYENPENRNHKNLPYWYDEIVFAPDKKDKVFIVEGLKDCLVLNAHFNQYGIHAIGLDSAGQTLDPKHLESLQKCCKELVLCLDNDKTGIAQNLKKSSEFNLPYLDYTHIVGTSTNKIKDFADLVLNVEHAKILDWLQDSKRGFSKQSTANTPKNWAVHSSTSTEQEGSRTRQQLEIGSKPKNILKSPFTGGRVNDAIEYAKTLPPLKKMFSSLIHTNELIVLFADNGIGKSMLAVQIAEAIAEGKDALEMRNECNAQNVIYYDFELIERVWLTRYKHEETGLVYRFSDNLIRRYVDIDSLKNTPSKDYTKTLIEGIESDLEEFKSKFIVIDNITGINLNDLAEGASAMELMRELDTLKKKTGCTILVLAHTPKIPEGQKITKNHLAGSKALSNFIDGSFSIGKCTIDAEIKYIKQIKSRLDKEELGENNVLKVKLKRFGNGFLGFERLGFDTEKALLMNNEQLVKALEEGNLIASIRDLADIGLSIREIATRLDISKSTIQRKMSENNIKTKSV